MESTTKEPRFALLTDDELSEFLDSSASENTKKSVRYAMKILDSYCKVRNTTVSALELMNHTDLDNFLRRFYTEVRQLDGEKYSKKSMQSIRYGLQKHFKDRENNPVDIVNDHAFERSNRCFKAMLVHLKKIGKGYSEHKNPITPEDMDKINASPVTDLSTPAGLQNKVYIDTMIYFCNRGRENVRDMKKTDFKINTDSNGLRYITKRDQLTKNNRENSSDKSQAGVMYEVPGNPRCPVNSLLLYMQKLHPICEYFWQRPKDNTCTSSDTTWYCNSPLGKNTLSNKLKEISTAARCGKIYTNHCFRATSVTILDNAGFESRDIMTVSGHHSETSIKNYSRTSESRKRDMSAVIAAAVNSKLSAAAAAPSSSHTEPAGEQGQFAAGPSSSHTEPAGPSSSHSEPAGPSSSHAEPAGLTPDQTHQQGQSSPLLTASQESLILRDVVNSPVHLGNITSSPVATNVNINADATNNRTFHFHGCIVNFYR